MMRAVVALTLLAISGASYGASCSDRDTDDKTTITSRLLEMYTQEQADTESGNSDKAKADASRLKEAVKIDSKGWLCTPHDKFYAAWVMRFSDDASVLQRAYELAQAGMRGRVPRANWLTAYLFDKWHVYLGRPQRYGAIMATHKNRMCMFEVDKLAANTEREQYDMPSIESQYLRVMSDNGVKATPSWDEMQRKSLWCPPLGQKKKR